MKTQALTVAMNSNETWYMYGYHIIRYTCLSGWLCLVPVLLHEYYINTFRPCFCTTVSNFKDNPQGRFAPLSHFWTVETLVFR